MRALRLILIRSALGLGLAVSAAHGQSVYWADDFGVKIRRAHLDGSNPEELFNGTDTVAALALDLDQGKMYWVRSGSTPRIQRSDLDGLGVEDVITLGPDEAATSIALDVPSGKIYWTDANDHAIRRADLDGSTIEELVTLASGDRPTSIALDLIAGKMYWIGLGPERIFRANLDGSGAQQLALAGVDDPRSIALDPAGGRIYWLNSDTDSIWRANLDGSGVQPILLGLASPGAIALDSAHGRIYWTDLVLGTISRADLDGSNAEIVLGTVARPRPIAVDGRCRAELVEDCNLNVTPDACDLAFETSRDCNANGRADECDLAEGSSVDENGNTVPDECECDRPFIALVPVGSQGRSTIEGNEIIMTEGGQIVRLEIRVGCWDRNGAGTMLNEYAVTIDATSYTSGSRGEISIHRPPCSTDDSCEREQGPGATCESFSKTCSQCSINTGRPDYVFAGQGSDAECEPGVPDFRTGASFFAGFGVRQPNPFPDRGLYGGAAVFAVSPDAAGTFTMGFGTALLFDSQGNEILPVTRIPALITIPLGRCCYSLPADGQCVDNVTEGECDAQEGTSIFTPNAVCEENGDGSCAAVPAVSTWGLITTALLLLTGAKIAFGHRRLAA